MIFLGGGQNFARPYVERQILRNFITAIITIKKEFLVNFFFDPSLNRVTILRNIIFRKFFCSKTKYSKAFSQNESILDLKNFKSIFLKLKIASSHCIKRVEIANVEM